MVFNLENNVLVNKDKNMLSSHRVLHVKLFTRHLNLHSYVPLPIQVFQRRLQFGSVSKCPSDRLLSLNLSHTLKRVKGVVVSMLVCLPPDPGIWVRALARDAVLCPWARHFTLTVPLSTQVYKWVPGKLMLGVTLRWTSIPSRGE